MFDTAQARGQILHDMKNSTKAKVNREKEREHVWQVQRLFWGNMKNSIKAKVKRERERERKGGGEREKRTKARSWSGAIRRIPPKQRCCWFYLPIILTHEGGTLHFLPFTQKISGYPYLKILDCFQLFLADAPIKENLKNSYTPSQSTFGTPSTKICFALIKNNYLQTLVEIIFRYH